MDEGEVFSEGRKGGRVEVEKEGEKKRGKEWRDNRVWSLRYKQQYLCRRQYMLKLKYRQKCKC